MTREQEVRDLVARVVEAHLAAAGAAPTGAAAPHAAPTGASATHAAATPTAPTASTPSPAGAETLPERPGGDSTTHAGPGVTIAIGADHGGFALKQHLREQLTAQGYAVQDCGTHTADPVDYPDYAHAVAARVGSGICAWGIVVDGAGIGSCMVANKVPGVRAALCHDLSSARNSREHNHANVLTLGARFVGEGLADEIVATWLATAWGPGRHAARVAKIGEIERRYARAASGGNASRPDAAPDADDAAPGPESRLEAPR